MAEAKSELVKKLLDGRREFTFEDGDTITTYFIADPSGEDIRKADWNYAKVFNKALADGFPTQAQMMDILVERGILSEDYTRTLETTKINLAAALYRLDNMTGGMTDSDQEDLALEIARLRDEFFKLNQKINGPMGNTCENLAEDARNEFITSRVIEKKDGGKLWPKYEDYLAEENNGLILKCRFEVMAWLNGMDGDFLQQMPEQKALRRLAEKRVEEALERVSQPAVEAQAEKAEAQKPVEDLQLPAEPAAEKPKRGPGRKRARVK